MLKVNPTKIVGCLIIESVIRRDSRGHFAKWFQADEFANLGLPTQWAEDYTSVSRRGVIRGLHFQTPPFEHNKFVICLQGSVLDVVLDVRAGSPTFGAHITIDLSADEARAVFIPAGCAHGFCALEDNTLMLYKVGSVHSPTHDSGIRWDSAGINWPIETPIVSARDETLPVLSGFISPFNSGRPRK
jgi:dTDP-4-dehydrorhamnose 3,5-epimerase